MLICAFGSMGLLSALLQSNGMTIQSVVCFLTKKQKQNKNKQELPQGIRSSDIMRSSILERPHQHSMADA